MTNQPMPRHARRYFDRELARIEKTCGPSTKGFWRDPLDPVWLLFEVAEILMFYVAAMLLFCWFWIEELVYLWGRANRYFAARWSSHAIDRVATLVFKCGVALFAFYLAFTLIAAYDRGAFDQFLP